MNTPEPCLTCAFLYADCLQDDDPNYAAECWLRLPIGDAQCRRYRHWEKISNPDRDDMIQAHLAKIRTVGNEVPHA